MSARRTGAFLIVVIAGLLVFPATPRAQSKVRLGFWPGSPYPGPPIYAQISYTLEFGWEIYHTDKWAAIPFYREPGCVPADFNLLDMFNPPVAWDCALTVQGFEIWTSPVGPPLTMTTLGLGAVPIYFVGWSALQEAVVDRVLTMAELNGLVQTGDAVVGTASFFASQLHPSGGTAVPLIEISANGLLQDGRRFQLQVAGGDRSDLVKHVKIAFE